MRVQALDVGARLAAQLELEVAQPVARDRRFERGGQAVVRIAAGVGVGRAGRPGRRCGAARRAPALRSASCDANGSPSTPALHAAAPRQPGGAQRGVGHRLVEQRGAELRRQARQPERHAARDRRRRPPAATAAYGVSASLGAEIRLARDAQRLAQLLEVLLVREARATCRTTSAPSARRSRRSTRAAVDFGLDAHEGLRAARDGGRAEAKRQAQRHRSLVELDAAQAQKHGTRGHVDGLPACRARSRRWKPRRPADRVGSRTARRAIQPS